MDMIPWTLQRSAVINKERFCCVTIAPIDNLIVPAQRRKVNIWKNSDAFICRNAIIWFPE